MNDDLIEKVARAICYERAAPCCQCKTMGDRCLALTDNLIGKYGSYGQQASAAIAACRDELTNRGAVDAYEAVLCLLSAGTPPEALRYICEANARALRVPAREPANQIANSGADGEKPKR